MLTKDEVSALFAENRKAHLAHKSPDKIKEEAPPPIELGIKRISRNGMMQVDFNQKLLIPTFLDVARNQFLKNAQGLNGIEAA